MIAANSLADEISSQRNSKSKGISVLSSFVMASPPMGMASLSTLTASNDGWTWDCISKSRRASPSNLAEHQKIKRPEASLSSLAYK